MQPDLQLQEALLAEAAGTSVPWLSTVQPLCPERKNRVRFYYNLTAMALTLPGIVMQVLEVRHLLESVSVGVTLGCLIPGLLILIFGAIPYCFNKDAHESIVAVVTDLVIRRNEEALACWAEAYPTLNARLRWTLRPDIADILLHRPLPLLGCNDNFCRALTNELLSAWHDPKQTEYALKIVQVAGERDRREHIGKLEPLTQLLPENGHQTRIQRALKAVLPAWKARP